MRDLDKTKKYDLSDLTNDELKSVWNYLRKNDEDWADCTFEEMINYQNTDRLCFNEYNWEWDDTILIKSYTIKKETINAKELFYTLENIQVDCSNETEEHIKEMTDVFEKNGFNLALDGITDQHFYLRLAKCGESVNFFRLDDTKTTITYEKFMELFTGSVEVLNEEKYIADLTLEQQLQKAEAEVKRLRKAIEDSKIKVGDLVCYVSIHNKKVMLFGYCEDIKDNNIYIGGLNYESKQCSKITDQELINKLNELIYKRQK